MGSRCPPSSNHAISASGIKSAIRCCTLGGVNRSRRPASTSVGVVIEGRNSAVAWPRKPDIIRHSTEKLTSVS